MTSQEEREWIKAKHLEADKLADETGMDWFLALQQCWNRHLYEGVPTQSTEPDFVQQPAA